MIWNVFLDMVTMLIALCLIVVVFGFGFWALAWIVRRIRCFITDVGSALRDELDGDTIKAMLGILPTTWCQGCDELVERRCMAFTELGLYRCNDCRGIETDGRPIEPTTSKYVEMTCDVCERPAPEWLRTTDYRCAECRPAHLPATAEEYRQYVSRYPLTLRRADE